MLVPAKQTTIYERFIIIKGWTQQQKQQQQRNQHIFISHFSGRLFHVRQVKIRFSPFSFFHCYLAFYPYSRRVLFSCWRWIVCSSIFWCAFHISHSSVNRNKSSAFYFKSQTLAAYFEEIKKTELLCKRASILSI